MDFLFGNHKGEERFTFNVQVQCVQPWVQLKSKGRAEDKPAGLVLKWNRDNKRSGTSKVAFVEPGDVSSDEEGAAAGAIHFNELFEIPATLHKEHAAHKSPSRGADGDSHIWQKKTIILTLHDAASDGQPKEPPLGRGVLDLAEFAAGGSDVMPVGKFLKIRLAVNKQIEKANGGQAIHIEATVTCLSAKAKKAVVLEKSMSLRQEKPKAELKKAKSALSKPAAAPPEAVDQDLIDSLMESEDEGSDGELSSQPGRQNGARNGQRESRATAEGDGEEVEDDEEEVRKRKGSAADDADDDSDLDFMTEDDFEAVETPKPKSPSRTASVARTPEIRTPTKPASTPNGSTPIIPASTPDRSTSKAPPRSQTTGASSNTEVQKGAKSSQEAKALPEASAKAALSKSAMQQGAMPPHPDYGEGVSDGAVVSAAVGKAGMAMPQGKPIALKNKPGTENAKMSMAVLDAAEKVRLAQERATTAESRVLRLEGELRDCAALEVAIHTAVSVHGQTAHKLHTPARRLARAYIQARGNGLWPPEIAAGTARNSVSGLILAARACGDDVGRLVYWWSNCVVLREMVAAGFDIEMRIAEERKRTETSAAAPAPKVSAEILEAERMLNRSSGKAAPSRDTPPAKPGVNKGDDSAGSSAPDAGKGKSGWKTAAGYCDALKKTEAWICGKVLQLLWWRVMNPPMQPGYRRKAEVRTGADVSTPPLKKTELVIDVSKVPVGRTDRAPPSKGPKVDKKGQIIGSNGKVVGFRSKLDKAKGPASPSSGEASESADVSESDSPSTSGVKTPASSRTRRSAPTEDGVIGGGEASPSGRTENGHENGSGSGNGKANGSGIGVSGEKRQGSRGGQGCEESPLECVELWKGVLLEVEKLCCPARAEGRECGCLHVLTQQVLDHCIARLDVALFNALLRDPKIDGPTDPISDPLTEPSALPIPAGKLTFGGGVQLKIAIKAWSEWLPQLLSGELLNGTECGSASPSSAPPGAEPSPYLRAAADLLMLPKEMLMDRAVRKEVCGPLTLPLIRRVLYLFVPDYHAPEPVPASLLAAFNAEVSMEKRRKGEADMGPSYLYNAPAAPCTYVAAPSAPLRVRFGKDCDAAAALDARGYSSDDEVDQAERPLQLLVEGLGGKGDPPGNETGGSDQIRVEIQDTLLKEAEGESVQRYQLLRRTWQPIR